MDFSREKSKRWHTSQHERSRRFEADYRWRLRLTLFPGKVEGSEGGESMAELFADRFADELYSRHPDSRRCIYRVNTNSKSICLTLNNAIDK